MAVTSLLRKAVLQPDANAFTCREYLRAYS
jgi:hypothetical protein